MADSVHTQTQERYIKHLQAFRGFAIINIVAIHCWGNVIHFTGLNPWSPSDNYVDALNEVIFHDSTLYFTLISGLLFSVIQTGRSWTNFFQRKLSNVVVPYLVITILFSLFFQRFGLFDTDRLLSGRVMEFTDRLVSNVLHGSAMYHLWYIPVLALLFLATPFIVLILKSPKTRWLIIPLILAPLISPRAWPEFSWNTVIYFLGAYSAGIYLGQDYHQKLRQIAAWTIPLSAAVAITTAILIYAYITETGRVAGLPFRETLFYIQKMCFALLVLLVLKAKEASLPRWLDPLATYALTIYFLHAAVLIALISAFNALAVPAPSALGTVALGSLFLIIAISVSHGIGIAVKRLTGKGSRFLIGT